MTKQREISPIDESYSALLSGVAQLLAQARRFPLPWSHYVRLLSVKNCEARAFYEREALSGGWSVRQLDRQISSQFYERSELSVGVRNQWQERLIPWGLWAF